MLRPAGRLKPKRQTDREVGAQSHGTRRRVRQAAEVCNLAPRRLPCRLAVSPIGSCRGFFPVSGRSEVASSGDRRRPLRQRPAFDASWFWRRRPLRPKSLHPTRSQRATFPSPSFDEPAMRVSRLVQGQTSRIRDGTSRHSNPGPPCWRATGRARRTDLAKRPTMTSWNA